MAEYTNGPVTGAGVVALPVAVPGGQSASQVTADSTQVAGIIFPSLSRVVAAYTSDEIYNAGARGVRLYTANDAAGGGTATVKIQVRAPNSDVWIDLAGAATAALGSSTGSLITVYPGLTGIADSAGVTINQHLGPAWRVVLTIAVATCVASVGADYLL